MPVFMTLLITKTILRLSRVLGRGGGSALPGLVAERLDPQIAAKLTRELPEGVIVITGTNGKTTTTKMLVGILRQAGKRVVTNRSGSNLTRGVVSSLIEHASLSGRLPYDLAVFEVDEATMPAACKLLKPGIVVVLNLFRDQLDRYGELDTTAKLIGKAIKSTIAQVYLNADDPLVASLAEYASSETKLRYFGVQESSSTRLPHDLAADSDHCPFCGRTLVYSHNFFGHIGHYWCPAKDFSRPNPDYGLSEIRSGIWGSQFEVKLPNGRARFTTELPGLYNSYNALAAVAVANELGIAIGQIGTALHNVSAAFGRVELVELAGRKVYLLLIKNPTGFNQIIQTFFRSPKTEDRSGGDQSHTPTLRPPILIAINDNFADGRDVSWLWDVAVEELAPARSQGSRVNSRSKIIVSGIRATDMALRLKYAGLESEFEPDFARAIKNLITATPEGGTAYILPTYTAMLAIRHLITKEAKLEGFWK